MPRHHQLISCSPHIDNLVAIFKAKLGRTKRLLQPCQIARYHRHQCTQRTCNDGAASTNPSGDGWPISPRRAASGSPARPCGIPRTYG